MARKNKIFRFVLLVCALLLCFGAQKRLFAADAELPGEGAPMPRWDAASPSLVSSLQSLMETPAGVDLTKQIPSLSLLQDMSAEEGRHCGALGALAKHLPADFDARLRTALRAPQKKRFRTGPTRRAGRHGARASSTRGGLWPANKRGGNCRAHRQPPG